MSVMVTLGRSLRRTPGVRFFGSTITRMVAVGDKIPSATVFDGSPGNAVDLSKETQHGKSIIIGVPGAFSPGCTASHVPGYLRQLRLFNEKGVDKFFIVAVNDPFVVKAWSKDLLENIAGEQVKFLADAKADLTTALDLKFDATKVFGNERSKRYALVVQDGKVVKTFVEPDNAGINVSDATKVLSQI